MALSTEQQIVLDYFLELKETDEAQFYLLNAPAGSGKTYLVNRLVCADPSVRVLVPTNKAGSLYRDSITIHKFFNAVADYGAEKGEMSFKLSLPDLREMYPKLKLLVVDEASMVSRQMMIHLALLPLHILFTCDEAQLPPVGEERSPVFEAELVARFELKHNFRQRDDEFSRMMNAARETSTCTFPSASLGDFVETFLEEDTVILCYTNERRRFWNSRVRRHIFKKETLDKIYNSEELVFTGCRKDDGGPQYHTSDIIEVHGVERIKMRFGEEWVDLFRFTDQHRTVWHTPVSSMDSVWNAQKKKILGLPSAKKRKAAWAEFYKTKTKYDPEVDYIYCSTVHKAQGSEWPTVYVDSDDIQRCRDRGLHARLFYTAVSRAREAVFFIG
jgi:hypothetical protein